MYFVSISDFWSAANWLSHESFPSDWLMLQLLWTFSSFDSFSIKLTDSAFRQADKLDRLTGDCSWGVARAALDNRLLGNADFALLVSVGVLHHGGAALLTHQGLQRRPHDLLLCTNRFLSLDLLLFSTTNATLTVSDTVGKCR